MFKKFLLIWCLLFFSHQSLAGLGGETFGNFDDHSLIQFKKLLQKNANEIFSETDFESYHKRINLFNTKESVKFSQKDVIIHTFAYLDRSLFDQFFGQGLSKAPSIKIYLNRESPKIFHHVSVNPRVAPVVRAAAKLSIYGTNQTPAIVSDAFVDHVAGISSAYSTLNAEMGFVYEGFRESTYHDLIIGHEGFHSAMRLLSTYNRMNRLAKYMPTPLANGAEYDPYLEQDISDLERMAAPNLDAIHIDERFISDHHGVIMATLHHGVLNAIEGFIVDYQEVELYRTKYPYHYIELEKNWDTKTTASMMERLKEKHDSFLMESESLKRMLLEVSKKIPIFKNILLEKNSKDLLVQLAN